MHRQNFNNALRSSSDKSYIQLQKFKNLLNHRENMLNRGNTYWQYYKAHTHQRHGTANKAHALTTCVYSLAYVKENNMSDNDILIQQSKAA